jgi:hypothetical protein
MLLGGSGIVGMLVWMPMMMLVSVAVIVGIIWWLMRWIKTAQRRSAPPMPYPAYRFQEGYSAQGPDTPLSEREGQERPAAPSYEQPQSHYPEMPEQRF